MHARFWLTIALVVGGLLLLADYYLAPVPMPDPPRQRETAAEHLAVLKAAFATPQTAEDDRATRFAERVALFGGRPTAAVDLFDAEQLALTAGVVAPAEEVYSALARGLIASLPDWTEATICRVDKLPGGRDIVVFVRHKTGPARWWLTESEGEVRAYDYEDCRVGIRLSELLAEGRDPRTAATSAIAFQALANPDANWELALAQAEAVPVRVLLRLAIAARALRAGDAATALQQANAADAERPGMPAVDLVREAAYMRLGMMEKADAARCRVEAILGRSE